MNQYSLLDPLCTSITTYIHLIVTSLAADKLLASVLQTAQN